VYTFSHSTGGTLGSWYWMKQRELYKFFVKIGKIVSDETTIEAPNLYQP